MANLSAEDIAKLAAASRKGADFQLLTGGLNLFIALWQLPHGGWHVLVGVVCLIAAGVSLLSWFRGRNPNNAPLVRAFASGTGVTRVVVRPVGMGTESSEVLVTLGEGGVVQLTLQHKHDVEPLLEVLRRRAPQAAFDVPPGT